MGSFEVMHPAKGHAVLTWDKTDAATWPEVEAAFNELTSNGMAIAATYPDLEDEVKIDKFDPQAERLSVIAPLAGG